MNGTSFVSSESPSCYPMNCRSLASQRVSKYLAEPTALGNTLVGLSNNTADAAASKEAHRKRIATELAGLEGQLSRT